MHGYVIADNASSVALISQAPASQFHTWQQLTCRQQQQQQQWCQQGTKIGSTAVTGSVVKAAAAGPGASAYGRDVTPAEGAPGIPRLGRQGSQFKLPCQQR